MGHVPLPPRLSWWLASGGVRLVGGRRTFKSSKNFLLTGERYSDEAMQEFELVRILSPLTRAFIRQFKGIREGYVPVEGGNLTANPVTDPSPYLAQFAVRVPDPFSLPNPGIRLRQGYSFHDTTGNWSPVLRIASFGTVTLKSPESIAGVVPLPSLEAEFAAATDPAVTPRILVPWETQGPGNLRGYVSEIADDVASLIHESAHDVTELIWAMLDSAQLVPTSPPDGWISTIVPTNSMVQEGESTQFNIFVNASASVSTALAVEVVDPDGNSAISEIVILHWNAEQQRAEVEFAAGEKSP